ncbi:CGNR zinc finger domain-containing protein [Pseudonocardia nigra]|uniref:CGNR zinc finger domain-containing protein n=1 Tax=Pseudonocardia nigra TaxID=1921578 RepID=UPI001C5F0E97|nr:ABATE domain-containing protein [Pseudonocardia nigra]
MDPAPLVGEPLALDLVNTVTGDPDGDGTVDLLATHDALRSWLHLQSDRLGAATGEVDLAALHALRAHVADAVEHARRGEAPPGPVLRALTAAGRAAPAYFELAHDGNAVVAQVRRSGDPTRDLLARLAEAAVDLLTDPAVRSVRACEGPGCRLLFLPAHPRRRWCSPALCGNRVRVARYYQRHKGGT